MKGTATVIAHSKRSVGASSATPDGHVARLRRCPACDHKHAVLTTCRECPACLDGDLTVVAELMFADLLPGGTGEMEALARHNESLSFRARCDADCGLLDCRAPYFDAAGLTRYRRPSSSEELADDGRTDRPIFGQPTKARR